MNTSNPPVQGNFEVAFLIRMHRHRANQFIHGEFTALPVAEIDVVRVGIFGPAGGLDFFSDLPDDGEQSSAGLDGHYVNMSLVVQSVHRAVPCKQDLSSY